ncbi:hypothetical protein RJ639_032086 [Escallonia herrerae]|uniref:RING-type domain-containing protein n=1 Tax=Escallonia herrerae TaxID=1293975 RepID=A0AA88X299_9ASTE|nr:hypothetical protein RJ639_032086 [Escallonia herrerae]
MRALRELVGINGDGKFKIGCELVHFSFDSPFALLTEKLMRPLKLPQEENTDKMLESCGSCVVKNVRTGIWIADLQLVRCPVCDLETCDGEQEICFSFHKLRGTMQLLDARHIELFLNDGYQDGSWEYEMIGSHDIRKHQDGASGAIFDLKHLYDESSSGNALRCLCLDLKSWLGKPKDWQPRVMVPSLAVAINTNLQENEGLNVKFQAMTAGAGAQECSTSVCGTSGFAIRFPFRLHGTQPENCSYPGYDLRCNSQGIIILSLPYSGEFFVRSINYRAQVINLYDPFNCLPSRLLDFNLSGSPFMPSYYQNFTFLSCPSALTRSRFTPIDCLSNSTHTTLATSSMALVASMTMCEIVATLPIPVSWPLQNDEGFSSDLNGDLHLTWDVPNCEDCEANGGMCRFQSSSSQEISCFNDPQEGKSRGLTNFKFLSLLITIPAIVCFIALAIFICFACTRPRWGQTNAARQNPTPAAVTPETANVTQGLDESTIESYAKVIVGESRRLPGPNDITCPICLSEYNAKDTLRCIPECQHCFHAGCIDEWLRMNGTCPVCRNSPSPAHDKAEDKENPKPWFIADEKQNKMPREDLEALILEYPLPEEMASESGKSPKVGFLGLLQKAKGKRKKKVPGIKVPLVPKRAKMNSCGAQMLSCFEMAKDVAAVECSEKREAINICDGLAMRGVKFSRANGLWDFYHHAWSTSPSFLLRDLVPVTVSLVPPCLLAVVLCGSLSILPPEYTCKPSREELSYPRGALVDEECELGGGAKASKECSILDRFV